MIHAPHLVCSSVVTPGRGKRTDVWSTVMGGGLCLGVLGVQIWRILGLGLKLLIGGFKLLIGHSPIPRYSTKGQFLEISPPYRSPRD